ncbi:palmitoyl-protein thioesterase [Roridomyces roridus]|uniref:Palmitoyl-protein thioesterase 1 n=1 Tax=Roridomyces roridus TaxID=1738132 RepID=A0AAD7CFK5_9AGAR|nr:palmitoyl-protein thioesterase [Roridomyces roridus]
MLLPVLFLSFLSFASATPRPLVLWHGLGDSATSKGMLEFAQEIRGVHPGIFIHSVYLDEDLDKDRRAGFYGNVNEQVEAAAEQISAIPELADGFNALGFSQGGQFLRAYVERFNSPPVHNLITFGSQHTGVSDVGVCGPRDLLCQIARRATKAGVYSPWAQENLVQAQYFRDPANLAAYYAANHFLTSINNELVDSRNTTYARNLASLNTLVLIKFTEERTVVPAESSWFGSEIVEDDVAYGSQHVLESGRTMLSMREQPLYQEDWIGLRELDERGGIEFLECKGQHMQIGDCWEDIVRQYAS